MICLEDFDNLSPVPSDANFAQSVVNNASRLIRITACPGRPNTPVAFTAGALTVTGADPAVTLTELQGDAQDPENRTGIAGLMTIRDISLMAVPDGAANATWSDALLDACETSKDRFAILDDPTDSPDLQVVGRHRDSSYGALYYPRLRVIAPTRLRGTVSCPRPATWPASTPVPTSSAASTRCRPTRWYAASSAAT